MHAHTDKTYRPVGRAVVRRIGEDTLLVPISGPPAAGRVYPVNETALTVWTCLSEGGTVARAAEILCARFDAPSREQVLADCEACAQEFVKESLLQECPA